MPRPKPRRTSSRLCRQAVVAVTGSIGALWAAQFILELRVRRLVDGVRVVMSASAAQLVTPAAMRAASGAEVLTGLFHADAPFAVGHMPITQDADVIIVMPATANIIGKAANAIADEAVSAVIVAAPSPVVFVPNMHERMWRNPLGQPNLNPLNHRGHPPGPPASGA